MDKGFACLHRTTWVWAIDADACRQASAVIDLLEGWSRFHWGVLFEVFGILGFNLIVGDLVRFTLKIMVKIS